MLIVSLLLTFTNMISFELLGVVIADSGAHVSTHTNENDHSEDTDEEAQKDYKVQESEDLRRLRSDPTFVELSDQKQVLEKRQSNSRVSRQRRQEHFRFEDEQVGDLDGDQVHRLAVEDPARLLEESRAPDVLADEPALIRGRLMHYESKGLRQLDRQETQENDHLDESGRRITERVQLHEHEEVGEDELPQRLYDNDRYVRNLRQVAGPHFDCIPAAEYSSDAVRLPTSNDRQPSRSALVGQGLGATVDTERYEQSESTMQEQRTNR